MQVRSLGGLRMLAAMLVVSCGNGDAGAFDEGSDVDTGSGDDPDWGHEHGDGSIGDGSDSADAGDEDGDASAGDSSSADDGSSGDDGVPYADTVPEGVDIACGNLAYPFELDPLAAQFEPRNAYWAMWMSWRAKLSNEPELADELATLGFDEFASIDIGNVGLQAFVAGSDDMVVVSFRGSQEVLDWLVNLNFPQRSAAAFGFAGQLHQGFADTLQAGWLDVLDAVSSFAAPNMPIVVTGQSLGGAMATLAASRLARLGYRVAPVYVFGSPRVGDVEFADEAWATIDGPVFRWVNDRDLVARLPPAGVAAAAAAPVLPIGTGLFEDVITDLDYAHVGTMFRYDGATVIEGPPMDDGEDVDYWTGLQGFGWSEVLLQQGAWHDIDLYLCLTRRLAYGV